MELRFKAKTAPCAVDLRFEMSLRVVVEVSVSGFCLYFCVFFVVVVFLRVGATHGATDCFNGRKLYRSPWDVELIAGGVRQSS